MVAQQPPKRWTRNFALFYRDFTQIHLFGFKRLVDRMIYMLPLVFSATPQWANTGHLRWATPYRRVILQSLIQIFGLLCANGDGDPPPSPPHHPISSTPNTASWHGAGTVRRTTGGTVGPRWRGGDQNGWLGWFRGTPWHPKLKETSKWGPIKKQLFSLGIIIPCL